MARHDDERDGLCIAIITLVVAVAFGLAIFAAMDAPMDGSTAGANAHTFEEVAHESQPRD